MAQHGQHHDAEAEQPGCSLGQAYTRAEEQEVKSCTISFVSAQAGGQQVRITHNNDEEVGNTFLYLK